MDVLGGLHHEYWLGEIVALNVQMFLRSTVGDALQLANHPEQPPCLPGNGLRLLRKSQGFKCRLVPYAYG